MTKWRGNNSVRTRIKSSRNVCSSMPQHANDYQKSTSKSPVEIPLLRALALHLALYMHYNKMIATYSTLIMFYRFVLIA